MAARTVTKYESASGEIHQISLSSQVAAVTGNAAPTGAVSSPIKAKVSKSNREYGIRPRGVRISRTFGTGDDTFKRYAFVPVLDPDNFGTGNFQLGGSITYNGGTWTVVALLSEDY